MKDMQVYDEEDLHEKERNGLESVDYQNPKFDTMKKGDEDVKKKEKEEMVIEDGDMWLDGEVDMLLDGQPEDLLEDSSIFYEDFPPLPDFPCISSSSSSSSPAPAPAPAPPNIIACSSSSSSSLSSSASSTDASNQDRYMQQHGQMDQPLLSTDSIEIPPFDHQMDFDCMDVMEELQDINLLDTDDIWDPSSIFPYENPQEEQQEHQQQQHQQPRQQQGFVGHAGDQQSQEGSPSEDLAMVFFEWLKSNKESISAEDLRSIKLKRSTIECAARRLGGGKEGMKQLVKLILEWVQNHHLHKRRMQEGEASPYPYPQHPQHFHNSNPNPNFNCNAISPDSNPCFSPSTPWIQHQTVTGFPSMVGYMGDPMFANMNSNPYSPSPSYPMIGSSATWAPQHFSLAPHYNSYGDHHYPPAAPTPPQAFASYPNQYPCQLFQGQGEQLVRSGSSATKEARKKRMARQRRFLSHHRSKSQQQQQQQRQNSTVEQHARLAGDDNCTSAGHATPSNWMFWSDAPPPPGDRPPLQPQHRQISERRQGWKPEKNLKFLLQKVLKQSDVGNLGRIVLPKKEAETHLPELEARDGISIAMEDIGTSRVWNMRYRFWPNNKSRMYLLENTGDFVRSNGLQEGDFIVIYSDVKSGKYMIRGVKVRQPGLKMEVRRPGKTRRNLHASSTAVDGSSSSSIKETVT